METQAAVKVLHTRVGSDDMEIFRKEARTIARLAHPHIVRVLEFGIENFSPYLVMTYAPKGTLRQRHPKGEQLPLKVILPYVKQVAGALQYIHDQKLVHRDVKPENLLLDASENILLSDFGIASLAHTTASQSTLGQAGTPHYMAPEQINHKPGIASDQYALGIVVYEWLCGIRPFQGDMFNIFRQHLDTPPPALRERLSTISPLVEVVVLKALAKDPKRRFASMKAFANALEQASKVEQAAPSIIPAPSIESSFAARSVDEEQVRQAKQEQPFLRGNINLQRSTLRPLTYAQDSLLYEAYALYIQKRLDEAIALYKQALKANTTNPLGWQGYGLALRLKGLHQDALSSFEHALKLDPELVTSWNGKGTVLEENRKRDFCMQQNRLDGLRVAIILSDDFEQAEMTEPRKALEQAGATTVLISPKPGQVTGMNHDVKADTFKVDMTLDQAQPNDFDAVMLPGGALNADFLRMNPKAQEFVRQLDKSGKPIAFICHAPWLLVSAGLVKGRKLTSYHTIQDDIRNAGGNWVDQEMVRDGNWVSSRSPQDLGAFNPAMVSLFAESRAKTPQH